MGGAREHLSLYWILILIAQMRGIARDVLTCERKMINCEKLFFLGLLDCAFAL